MDPKDESKPRPEIVVVGGPNGAGKTTTAARILPHGLSHLRFLNADFMAKGISPHDPDGAAIEAGRMMITRMRDCVARRMSFAFESTLASRGFARFLEGAKRDGYVIRLGYVSLARPELAVHRVSQRVARGGHDIPTPDILRRYWRSLVNFERLYRPLMDAWSVYDNNLEKIQAIASQKRHTPIEIHEPTHWRRFESLRDRALKDALSGDPPERMGEDG